MLDDFESYCLESYKNPTLSFSKFLPKNTAILIGKGIKGFYKWNKIDLANATLKRLFRMPKEKKRTYVPTKKDIRKFRDYANPRDKLLIEFTTNVPLRRQEIVESLTWRKLDLTKPYPMTVFKAHELKGHGVGRYEGCLFLGIICESVRKKLIERKKEEELRFQREKEKWEGKGYTFTSEFTDKTNVFLSSEITINEEEKTVSIEPLSYKAIGNLIYAVQKRVKIPLSIHKLRDYFQDTINAHAGEDANSVYANAMTAHKIEGTKRIYSHPEKQYHRVLEVFKKLEPYVDLDYDETKAKDKMKRRAKELQEQGKPIEEIIEVIMRERTQMLLTEMTSLKETMLSEVQKAETEYKKRTEE